MIQSSENGVVSGSYGSLKVTGNNVIWYNTYEFVLMFRSNYVPVLHHFWDIADVGWLRGTVVVARLSLAGELSLSCAWPVADGWPLMWVNRPL